MTRFRDKLLNCIFIDGEINSSSSSSLSSIGLKPRSAPTRISSESEYISYEQPLTLLQSVSFIQLKITKKC